MTNYEGFQAEQELPCCVYRVDADGGVIEAVITDMRCPNGLAFSLDESQLYVSDTGRMFESDPQHIRVYNINNAKASDGDVFHTIAPGCSDGIRLDTDGNIWSSAADGVHCISPKGDLLGKILVPELVSNVCFGGRRNHQLFITATSGVYMISLNRQGV